jgi:DNA-binding transcriptional regulator GbsR (MarR family)
MDIPFSIIYQNHDYPFIQNQNLNRFSFRYDREAYMQGLKKKLQGKIDPENFLPKISDPVDMLKATAQSALNKDLNEIKQNYKGLLDDKIAQVGDTKELFLKNTSTVRQQLMSPDWLKEVQQKTELLSQLQMRMNAGLPFNKEEYEQLKQEVEKYNGVLKLVNKMEEHKRKWESSGLVQKIKESGLLKKEKLKQILNDPGVIAKSAKQHLSLNSIQRLFLKVTKLDLGQSTALVNSLGKDEFLMNGVNTAFLSNRTSIGVLAGSQRTFNSLSDMPFTNSINNTNNKVVGVNLGKSNLSGSNQNMVSLLMAQSLPGANQFLSSFTVPRSSLVATIARKIELDKRNRIEIELSKSVGQYGARDSSGKENGLKGVLNTDDFFSNASVSVNYTGYHQHIGLENTFYFKASGINYDNPVMSFEPAGAKEAGLNLRKFFLKNKLQVTMKTDWREYKFSSASDRKWRTSYHFADVKWKMKKGQYIALRYQPVQSVRIADGKKYVTASTQRLSFLASLTKKIGGNQYRNTVNLAYQQNKYTSDINSPLMGNTSLQFSSMQNIVIGKYAWFNNTMYNYVNNSTGFIFLTTSFNNDLGVAYTIGKTLGASSSIVYQSVDGWYKQISVRQSLSGQLGKRINMSVYVDAGKNIKVIQPIPFNTVRAEWSIQYLFNKN